MTTPATTTTHPHHTMTTTPKITPAAYAAHQIKLERAARASWRAHHLAPAAPDAAECGKIAAALAAVVRAAVVAGMPELDAWAIVGAERQALYSGDAALEECARD